MSTPPRFSWPMRLFLTALLLWMTFRTFSIFHPWRTWRDLFDLSTHLDDSQPWPTVL